MSRSYSDPSPAASMSSRIRRHSGYFIRAYYQYFHDAHPVLPPIHTIEGFQGMPCVPEKVIRVVQYIGSHFLNAQSFSAVPAGVTEQGFGLAGSDASLIQSEDMTNEEKARRILEFQAFSCLPEKLQRGRETYTTGISVDEETQTQTETKYTEDGFQVQCMLLLSISAHAHGNFAYAMSIVRSATELALKLGMHRSCFATTHGQGSPVLEEMWRRTYWELFVVESLLSAQVEGTATLYEIKSDVPLPCDEEMPYTRTNERHNCTYSVLIQDLINHCTNRALLVDPLPSFAYRVTAAHFLGSVMTLPDPSSCTDAGAGETEIESFYSRLLEHIDHKGSSGGIGAQPDHVAQILSQARVITCSAMVYFYRKRSKLSPIKLQRIPSNYRRQSPQHSGSSPASRARPSTPVFPGSFILHYPPHSRHYHNNSSSSSGSSAAENLYAKATLLITSDPSSNHLISTAKQLAMQLNNPRLVRGHSPLMIDAIVLAMLVELAALLLLLHSPSPSPSPPSPALDPSSTSNRSTTTMTTSGLDTTILRERISNEFKNSLGVLRLFAVRWPLAKTVRDLLIDEYENLFRPDKAR